MTISLPLSLPFRAAAILAAFGAWLSTACGVAPPRGAMALAATPDAREASSGEAAAGGPRQNAPATGRVFVANQGGATISVIDAGTLEVTRTIDLREFGFSANAKPHDIQAEPDGSAWYVSLIGENRVVKFSPDGRVLGQADFEIPGLLALHPGGELIYSTHTMSIVTAPATIARIRRTDMTVDEVVDVLFPRPHVMEARPQGDYVYTASLGVYQVASVNVETGEVELLRFDGPNPVLAHAATAPDGSTMVVTTHSGELFVFDLSEPATPRLTDRIRVGALPWLPEFSPDGRHVYVPNQGDNTVSVVDMDQRAVVATIEGEGFAEPYAALVSPDGSRVFVSNSNTEGTYVPPAGAAAPASEPAAPDGNVQDVPVGTVVVIDAATNAVTKVIPVGAGTTGMTFVADAASEN